MVLVRQQPGKAQRDAKGNLRVADELDSSDQEGNIGQKESFSFP